MPRLLAFLLKITAHAGHIKTLILHIHIAVHKNHGNARLLRLLQHRLPACLHHRRKDNIVYPLGDKAADRLELVFLLLSGVVINQKISVLLCEGILYGFRIRCPPPGLAAKLRYSNHNPILFLDVRFLLNIRKQPAAGEQQGYHHHKQQSDHYQTIRSFPKHATPPFPPHTGRQESQSPRMCLFL